MNQKKAGKPVRLSVACRVEVKGRPASVRIISACSARNILNLLYQLSMLVVFYNSTRQNASKKCKKRKNFFKCIFCKDLRTAYFLLL